MPYAVNGDINIYYKVEGEGFPLVLSYGFMGYLESWRDYGYVDALKDDYTIITMDARGHGKSDKPHDPQAYIIENRIKDIIAVLDNTNVDMAHFFGYSYGGRIGFDLAYYFPRRFKSMIIGGASPIGDENIIQHEWISALESGMDDFVTLIGLSDMESEMKTMLLANDNLALAAILKSRPPEDHQEHLPKMNMPFLLFAGDKDDFSPHMEAASRMLPDATFVNVPGDDHNTALANIDTILPHIKEFLSRVNK